MSHVKDDKTGNLSQHLSKTFKKVLTPKNIKAAQLLCTLIMCKSKIKQRLLNNTQ